MTNREYRLSIARGSTSPKAAAFIARLESMTDAQYDHELMLAEERAGFDTSRGPRAPITITQSRRH